VVRSRTPLAPRAAAERLAADAAVFKALLKGVSAEQARWQPDPSQWAIVEVVNHLADEEAEDFRRRLELTLFHPGEAWPGIDPKGWATERQYLRRDLKESLDRFLEQRSESVAWLRELVIPSLDAAYDHPQVGTLRAGDLLAAWLAHDLIHIRQITRLHYRWLEHQAAPYQLDYAGPF
jgi:hypothetical protein